MGEHYQSSLQLQAYAKVNLTLDVGCLRSDGYHEIRSVMQTIDLADTLIITSVSGGITVRCTPPGAAPDGPSNLAHRALMSLADRLPDGVDLQIIKRIPAAAGLGGGSSDAAAALMAANRLYGLNLTEESLASLAGRLGSDVPFFIYRGTALAEGRGELVTRLPAAGALRWLVLVTPDFQVSTADVYASYQSGPNRAWTTQWLAAVSRGDREAMSAHLGNDLEPVVVAAYPEVSVLIKSLERLGASRALMSGSGPTVFGVFPGEEEARTAASQLNSGCGQVFVCCTIDAGVG